MNQVELLQYKPSYAPLGAQERSGAASLLAAEPGIAAFGV